MSDRVNEMLKNRGAFMEAHKLFHKAFRTISFSNYMDKDLTVLFLKPVLDIVKFDNWLHEQYGEYERQGLSMNDLLASKYGESVSMQIRGLLA